MGRTIVVDKSGSDTTGNGTVIAPFLTIKKAFQTAMAGTSVNNPTVIYVAAGVFTEDNSSGPLAVTSSGFTLIGQSSRATLLVPSTPTNGLYTMNNVSFVVASMRIEPLVGTSTSTAFAISGSFSVYFTNVLFRFWKIPISCSGNGPNLSSILIDTCLYTQNETTLSVSSTNVLFNDSQVRGSIGLVPLNTYNGILATDAQTVIYVSGSLFVWLGYAVRVANQCAAFINGCNFVFNNIGVLTDTVANTTLVACSFSKLDDISGTRQIGLKVTDSGSYVTMSSSTVDGRNVGGVIEGIGISVINNGKLNLQSCTITNCYLGIQLGVPSGTPDGQATECVLSSVGFETNSPESLHLRGTCTFIGSLVTVDDIATIVLETTDNVKIVACDTTSTSAFLSIGNFTNTDLSLMKVATKVIDPPVLEYRMDIYDAESLMFNNPDTSAEASIGVMCDQASSVNVMSRTSAANQESSLRLVSDTSATAGDGTSFRGWRIFKTGGTAPNAQLSFTYQNSIIGQDLLAEKTIFQIDASDVPTELFRFLDCRLTWGTSNDTDLYKNSAGVLRSSGNLILDGITASRALTTNASSQLVASATTDTQLGYLSSVTSSVQTQLDNRLPLSGGTLTGPVIFTAGSAALPSVNVGSNGGLFSEGSGQLDFATAGVHRVKINASGTVFFLNYGTIGVLHCAGTTSSPDGQLTSSLIVDDDITNATISTAKLASVSSGNTSSYIVQRDGSGNFSANMITLSGTTTNSTDVATKAYVDSIASTGVVFHEAVRVVSIANIASLTGTMTIDGVALNNGDRVLLTAQTSAVENGAWVVGTPWTRPTDFAAGNEAKSAYFSVTEGTAEAGSAWVCSTPTAIIDTDPLSFAIFSSPVVISGTNVGTGTGSIFQSVVGTNINFRTLLNDGYLIISTATNEVKLAVDATSTNSSSKIVARDGSGNFAAGTITGTLVGSASLNLLLTGGTLSGSVLFPDGSAGSPSVQVGTTGTGLSSTVTNQLDLQTNGAIVASFGSTGVLFLTSASYTTASGILHAAITTGQVTSSLITNGDVDPSAAIVDTKLATLTTPGKVSNAATTATSANTANAIVARNASGNFTAGTITANLLGNVTGASSDNVLKAGDTMTGTLTFPIGLATAPSILFTGTGAGFSSLSGGLQLSTASLLRLTVDAGGAVTISSLNSSGIVHTSSAGLLSTSLITNSDVHAAAAIVDTKLDTLSTPGKVNNSATTATAANTASAIVARDSGGNFTASTVLVTVGVDGSGTVGLGLTSATAVGIGSSGITTTVNGTFTTAVSRGSWYCKTNFSPSFTANTNRLTTPGSATAGTLVDMTHASTGVLTYTGTRTRTFDVKVSITFTSGPSGSNMIFFISKNSSTTISTTQCEQRIQITGGNNANQMCLTLQDQIDLATNDTIQLAGTSALTTSAVVYNFVSMTAFALMN